MGSMNVGLQRDVIERRLRSKGYDVSTVDLNSLIDSQLSLPENIASIEQEIRATGDPMSRGKARRLQHRSAKREASSRHEKRPDWNQRVDESLQADTVFRNPSERQMRKWKRNPDKYDIEGVDTKRPISERQIASPPRKEKRGYGGVGSELLKEHDRKLTENRPDTNLSPEALGHAEIMENVDTGVEGNSGASDLLKGDKEVWDG